MKRIFIALIRLYRLTLSPLIGQQCRFEPTCSHYGEEAIERFGALQGGWLTLKRIGKCGPWHQGGYDPVPDQIRSHMIKPKQIRPEQIKDGQIKTEQITPEQTVVKHEK